MMNINLGDIDWDKIQDQVCVQLRSDIDDLMEDLDNERLKAIVRTTSDDLAALYIQLLQAEDEEERKQIRMDIGFCESTLSSAKAIKDMKMYSFVVETTGNIIGAIIVGAVKAAI